MNNKIFFFLLIAGLLVLSACSQGLPANIKEKLIDANTKLDTYEVDIDMSVKTKTSMAQLSQEVMSESNYKGYVDRPNKKMHVSGNMRLMSAGMAPDDIPIETYIDNDLMYTKTDNYWLKSPVDKNIWDQQDQIAQTIDLLATSEIKREKDQMMNNQDYYVFSLIPNIKQLAEQEAAKQNIPLDVDLADVIKQYEATLWVNKETLIIEKTRSKMKMLIEVEEQGQLITTDSDIDSSTVVKNINKPVTIDLPEEAEDAITMEELMAQYEQES